MGTSGQRQQSRSRRSNTQKQQLAKLNFDKYRHRAQKENKNPKTSLRQQLNVTKNLLNETLQELSNTQNQLKGAQNTVSITSQQLSSTRALLDTSQITNSGLYRMLRVERRKNQRYDVSRTKYNEKIKQLTASLETERKSTALALRERDRAREAQLRAEAAWRSVVNSSETEIAKYKRIIVDCRAKNRAFQMQTLRSNRARDKSHAKAKQAARMVETKRSWNLKKGGAYTPDARAMARMLVKAGCSQGKVGSVIQHIANKAGRSVKGKMARRTVQRALMEGGIAARIQLAHEMADADGKQNSLDNFSILKFFRAHHQYRRNNSSGGKL